MSARPINEYLDAYEHAPPRGRKTKTWEIANHRTSTVLGVIHWHGAWRQYVFWPFSGTLYNPACLHDIAAFCEQQTRLHREAKAA